jgi:hypothetical protein
MEDRSKRYLDKVVELLVNDTNIDKEKEEIKYPFKTGTVSLSNLRSFSKGFLPIQSDGATFVYPYSFFKYTGDMYGLSEQEIRYVWKNYKGIILNRIYDGR